MLQNGQIDLQILSCQSVSSLEATGWGDYSFTFDLASAADTQSYSMQMPFVAEDLTSLSYGLILDGAVLDCAIQLVTPNSDFSELSLMLCQLDDLGILF